MGTNGPPPESRASRKDQATRDRPLRADARKNRERILEAASAVFARDGLDASLDAVAAEAKVGVGTVYRRFPERGDLIKELFTEKVGKFVALAEECDAMSDPFEGLVRFLADASRMHGEDVGLRQLILGPGIDGDLMALPRRKIGPILTGMIERAQAEGELREDLTTLDIPLIELMLARINDLTGPVSPDLWERLLVIVIDALRVRRDGVTGMPVGPMTPEQYLTAIKAANKRGSPD